MDYNNDEYIRMLTNRAMTNRSMLGMGRKSVPNIDPMQSPVQSYDKLGLYADDTTDIDTSDEEVIDTAEESPIIINENNDVIEMTDYKEDASVNTEKKEEESKVDEYSKTDIDNDRPRGVKTEKSSSILKTKFSKLFGKRSSRLNSANKSESVSVSKMGKNKAVNRDIIESTKRSVIQIIAKNIRKYLLELFYPCSEVDIDKTKFDNHVRNWYWSVGFRDIDINKNKITVYVDRPNKFIGKTYNDGHTFLSDMQSVFSQLGFEMDIKKADSNDIYNYFFS